MTLTSDNANVTVPASVTIPAHGRLSFVFTVQSNFYASGSAHVTGTLMGLSRTFVLTFDSSKITPPNGH